MYACVGVGSVCCSFKLVASFERMDRVVFLEFYRPRFDGRSYGILNRRMLEIFSWQFCTRNVLAHHLSSLIGSYRHKCNYQFFRERIEFNRINFTRDFYIRKTKVFLQAMLLLHLRRFDDMQEYSCELDRNKRLNDIKFNQRIPLVEFEI